MHDSDPRLRGLFTPEQVYNAMGSVHPGNGKIFPIQRELKPGERVLTCTEAQILYSAFQYENDLEDDLPKKAAIKKRFLNAMEPQMGQRVDREAGGVIEFPLPGFPRRNFRFKDPSVLCFTPEQASYLKERMTKFKTAKDKEGKPLLTADSADAWVDLMGDGDDLKGILKEWMEDTRELKKEHVEDAKVEAEVTQ